MEKCPSCRGNRLVDSFQKNNKKMKTCSICREKANKKQPIEQQTTNRFMDHHLKFKRLNEQFLMRASFPRHKFETKYVMTDIRDCHRPSCEVVFTNR